MSSCSKASSLKALNQVDVPDCSCNSLKCMVHIQGMEYSGVEMGLAEKNFYSLKVFLLLEALQISFIHCIQKEACQYLDPVL